MTEHQSKQIGLSQLAGMIGAASTHSVVDLDLLPRFDFDATTLSSDIGMWTEVVRSANIPRI